MANVIKYLDLWQSPYYNMIEVDAMQNKITTIAFKLNSDLIAKIMEENNISIEALSFFSKINFFRLLRILDGRSQINVSELMILADMLKVPLTSLMIII